MAFNYSPKIVASGLTTYLDAANRNSYIGSGTSWKDISRQENNATLTNGPTFNSDNGGSIVFDGTDDHVRLKSIIVNSNFTISSFLKYTVQSTTTRILTIVASYNTLVGNNYLQIRIYDTTIQLIYSNTSVIGTFANSSIALNTNNQVCVTRTGNTYDCYINGQYRSSLASSLVFTTTEPSIGINGGAERYQGNIYNFMNYNRALSATEVLQNYNATRTRFGI